MPSTFIFGHLKLKLSFCGVPFPKSIVNGDVVINYDESISLSFLASTQKVDL